MAGVAQTHIYRRFAWQAWHLWYWVAPLGFVACDARGAAPLHVAGVALGDIHLDITWQAWHLVTSTFVSRGRRGTNSHLPSFCVAGVALMVLGGALGSSARQLPPLRLTDRSLAPVRSTTSASFRLSCCEIWIGFT